MTYFIALDGTTVFVYGQVKPGQIIAAYPPHLELYPTLAELNARLAVLGQPPLVEPTN